MRLWYECCKRALFVFFRVWFRLRVEGREHEPRGGGVLAVCNHASAIDPPIAGAALRRPARYMAKDELFKIPILGLWLRSIGAFPVRRGEADRQSIRRSLQILHQNEVLVMFPEGTRSMDGRLRAAEPGAALIALRSGATVLPMAVVGSQIAMPKGAKFPRRRPVTVKIGPPFEVPKIEGRIERPVLDEYSRKILDSIASLLPPEQLPDPGDRISETKSAARVPTTPGGAR